MDYYPQPRPVLYGTCEEETPAQTQTAPVRIGPPRYPPAPPMAGDAPGPFQRPSQPPPVRVDLAHRWGAMPLALLYAVASVYSLGQILEGAPTFANATLGIIMLTGEIAIGLVVIASLAWLKGREYLLALGLVALHFAVGVVFSQWQSPGLWAAVIVLLYLVRPLMIKQFIPMARDEIRADVARNPSGHPRHHDRSLKSVSRSGPDDWRIRW